MTQPTAASRTTGLDRVLHEKARLGILTALVTHRSGLSFGDLARLCSLTDGNLSRHLDVLAGRGAGADHQGLLGSPTADDVQVDRRRAKTIPRIPGRARTGAARRRRGRSGRQSPGKPRPGLAGRRAGRGDRPNGGRRLPFFWPINFALPSILDHQEMPRCKTNEYFRWCGHPPSGSCTSAPTRSGS